MENKNYIVLLLSIFLLFSLLHGLYTVYLANQSLKNERLNKPIILKGIVIGIPLDMPFKSQIVVKSHLGKIKLTWYRKPRGINLIPGQVWQFNVILKNLPQMRHFYGFDYGEYLRQSGFIATGMIVKNNAKLLSFSFFNAPIDFTRYYLKSKLSTLLSDKTFLGIFNALIIGDKSKIHYNQLTVFRKTATAHLIAISGLHVGLVSLWAYLIMRLFWSLSLRLCQILPAQKAAWIFSIIMAFIYSLLAGFALPTQRAVIMIFMFAFFYLFDLSVAKRHILIFTAILVSFYNPYAIFSPSFWLSFGAVGFLLFVFTGRIGRASLLSQIIKPQLVATISLIPLTVFYFDGFSLVGMIANLIAVPVVSFLIVPLLLISVIALSFSDWVAFILLFIGNFLFKLLWIFLYWLSKLDFSFIHWMIYPSKLALILALVGMIILFLPKAFANRYFGGLLILPLFFYRPSWPNNVLAKLTLLDVGHGLAVVFQLKNYLLVYDTGNRINDVSSLADQVIVPYLKITNKNHIDRLVISHGDLDHSGGAKSLLSKLTIERLDASSKENIPKDHQQQITYCNEKQSWAIDQIKFSYLNPLFLGGNASKNDLSCVLKISMPNFSVLLPGDIEKKGEKYLLNYHYDQLKSNVLIAPHHGSKSSSTIAFLRAVLPDIILISNKVNRRGYFPHKSIVKRYNELKINYLDTARFGDIELIVYKNGHYSVHTRLNAKI